MMLLVIAMPTQGIAQESGKHKMGKLHLAVVDEPHREPSVS